MWGAELTERWLFAAGYRIFIENVPKQVELPLSGLVPTEIFRESPGLVAARRIVEQGPN